MGVVDDFRNRVGNRLITRRRDAAPPPTVSAPLETWGDDLGGVANRFDAIVNFLTGLGGANDKGRTARPRIEEPRLNDLELTALYLDNGISRRIIDLPVDEMTRKGWGVTINSQDDDEEPETDSTADEDERLCTFDRVNMGVKMGDLYGGSVVLMVTTDDIPAEFLRNKTPAQWLETPLDLDRVISLDSLQVFDTFEAFPIVFESDLRNNGYRDPLIWSIAPTIPFTERSTSIGNARPELMAFSRVHASRVLFFRGRKRPPSWRHQGSSSSNRAMDDSMIQAIWEEIRNLTSTMQGGATLAQELRETVVTVAGLEGMTTSDQAEAFQTRMKLIAMAKAILGLIVLGPGDKYENRSNPPTGFKELSSEAQAMLSAVTGYPQTILFGTVPAGLGKDDVAGRQQWDRLVSGRQTRIRPQLHQFYEVMFSADEGPTGGQIPEKMKVEFKALDEPSEAETATTRKTNAESDTLYLNAGVLQSDEVREARFGPKGYQTDIVVSESDIDDIDDDAAATAEAEEQARLDAMFTTGKGGTNPHTHTFETGAKRTDPGGDDGHTHAIKAGAAKTGPGDEDKHTHSVPKAAR